MDQEVQRKVVITDSGEQIPIETAASMTAGVIIPGDAVKEEILLDVTAEEFAVMKKQAMKNRIPRAMLMKKRKTDVL